MDSNIEITAEIIQEHGISDQEYEMIRKILKRDPNINELGMYSVLWSEHCSYKNSKPLLKLFPTTGKHVLQGPGENAGIVDIGDGLGIAFKIESHNHPSAVEPYQGAATGIGGIIRDIFSMGARPIAGLDSLRFGDITKDQRSKYLFEQVVKGIGDYGNCVGIPTVAGDVYFEDSYTDNCLVNAMCVGVVQNSTKKISPLYGEIVKGYASGVGNPVLYVGSSTGRDGIHGATFASIELSDESEGKKSSVQVGDPFQEKLLIEACLELIKTGCISGMQDMGAAGLTSSLSEMASRAGTGIEIDVAKVPTREKNMTPYEMLLSESQERMVIVLEKGKEQMAYDVFEKWDLHAVHIGKVTNDKMFRVLENGKIVAEVPARSLVDDAPVYHRTGKKPSLQDELNALDMNDIKDVTKDNAVEVLRKLLTSLNIASRKWIYEQYDHMVQTNTLIYPGQADAAVLSIKDTNKKIAVKTDGNGRYCYLNPWEGGKIVVAESARNVACCGATPIAITNCLNFGNPEKPEAFWQLENAVKGMSEACSTLDTPVISGNVSLYNEHQNGAIYPTPVVGILGLFETDCSPMTMSFKNNGDSVYLVGKTYDDLGGSEYLKEVHGLVNGNISIDLQVEKKLQKVTIKSIQKGIVNSAHDLADGGFAVSLVECLLDNNFGVNISLQNKDNIRNDSLLFGETQSRIIFSVSPEKEKEFEKIFEGFVVNKLGVIDNSKKIVVSVNGEDFINTDMTSLNNGYYLALQEIMA